MPNFCTVEYDGSCYQLVQQTLDWFSARTHCHNAGGYLADAYTADENNVIRQIVIDIGATGACGIVSQHHAYVGATETHQLKLKTNFIQDQRRAVRIFQ